ncbi:MAG: lipoyl(octanoyl) transferase LipB [Phycisphaerales bacterium]|nr:MAG: lipoyl(octanoyl) transferase LipB [Phycisphaerales bacterium]
MQSEAKETPISTLSLQNQVKEKTTTTKPHVEIRDCGLADYREILKLQLRLCRERQQGKIPNTVLIVEHPAVITLGARQSLNKLLIAREELENNNIDVVDIRRGGGTTAHNPGQLVCYPIFNLRELGLGISEYIRALEATGAELLEQLGVHSTRRKGSPGLWIGERKIASIGVRVSKSVTCHGMAINIRNDLNIFDFMVPCGLDHVEMTSVLKETGRDISMNKVKKEMAGIFVRCFSVRRRCRTDF